MRILLVVAALAGCAANNTGSFEIDGAIGGTGTAPMAGSVIVAWDIGSSGSYKYGDGTSMQASFVATLPADPPAGAINPNGLAVGYVVLLDQGVSVGDGAFDLATVRRLGITTQYAIVWKDVMGTGLGTWDTSFGPRYSCAHCIHGITRDTLELAPCASVTIELAGQGVCNWR